MAGIGKQRGETLPERSTLIGWQTEEAIKCRAGDRGARARRKQVSDASEIEYLVPDCRSRTRLGSFA
ncbi:hypothetical protein M529_22535 [Sphingobium ummariense RL-3]|uniref:Uncharacterized protein n=1 Tax=Sphingobium ummariense RL-3 TaxID=1346791 RepID=T0IVU4_9SPHN|nr:hypothetical protein M529_22535 [Sphingobium ummariense RL-3]